VYAKRKVVEGTRQNERVGLNGRKRRNVVGTKTLAKKDKERKGEKGKEEEHS